MIVLANELLDPGAAGVALSALLVVGVLGLALACGVNLIKEGLIASARTTVQLLGVGLILGAVFSHRTWFAVLGVLGVMCALAGLTAARRLEHALAGTGPAMTVLLTGSMALTLTYVAGVVVGVREPDPRYLIPLGGIILGSAITAATLAAQRLHDDLTEGHARVEAALALGASPAQATREPLRRALRAALTPTVNAMLLAGIIKLPGVMTGQMLGGAPPFAAAKYQIVVMFMLLFADGVTALGVLVAVRRLAFTRAWQPRL